MASLADYVARIGTAGGELWVFAFGSLMWRMPEGVRALRTVNATLPGYERSFCVYSRNYRGSPAAPGLVLGLQPSHRPGGGCQGVAVHLGSASCAEARQSLQRIDAQEMIAQSNPLPVYVRRCVTLRVEAHDQALGPGRGLEALAYTANAARGANAPALTLSQRADIIAGASGARGSNREYLEQTAAQLAALGIRDETVSGLAELVRRRCADPDACE